MKRAIDSFLSNPYNWAGMYSFATAGIFHVVDRLDGTGPSSITIASLIAGAVFNGCSFGGYTTYKAYKRTLRHIEQNERMKREPFKPKWLEAYSSQFCTWTGVKLAAKEKGLQRKLEEARREYNIIVNPI